MRGAALQTQAFQRNFISSSVRPFGLRGMQRPHPRTVSRNATEPKNKPFDEFTMTAEQKNQYVHALKTKGFFTLKMSKETERLLDVLIDTEDFKPVGGVRKALYTAINPGSDISVKVKNFLEELSNAKCTFKIEIRQWGKLNVSEYWHVDGHAVGVIATLRGKGTRMIAAPYHRKTVLDATWAEPASPDLERSFHAEPREFYIFTGDKQPERFPKAFIHASPHNGEGRIIFIARAAPEEAAQNPIGFVNRK
jgi:hypothetical protein